jgi:hypothetical protein
VARSLVQRDPAHLTLEFYKADRRILVDTGRNELGDVRRGVRGAAEA